MTRMRFRPVLTLALAAALAGCGDEEALAPTGAEVTPPGESGSASAGQALELRPRLELVGLGDILDELVVTRLSFGADLFLLPDVVDGQGDGDAIPIEYELSDGRTTTTSPRGDLRLDRPGRYRVLVRVRPLGERPAVVLQGAYAGPIEPAGVIAPRNKADEPAPSPAEPAPSPAEPAPSPADEPAPSPADEPAPSPADEPPSADEPAPSPAEPAPSPARAKPGEAARPAPGGEQFFVRSNDDFEFFAGVVEVTAGSRTLVVTWDVRNWLRGLLAEPLGVQVERAATAPRAGFAERTGDFRLESE